MVRDEGEKDDEEEEEEDEDASGSNASERRSATKGARAATPRRTDEADAAVDHELRLRRIERDLLRAASARREAGGVHAEPGVSTQTPGQPRPRRPAKTPHSPNRNPRARRSSSRRRCPRSSRRSRRC